MSKKKTLWDFKILNGKNLENNNYSIQFWQTFKQEYLIQIITLNIFIYYNPSPNIEMLVSDSD